MPCRIRITPRKFWDAAKSGWRASIASSSFNACGKLFASNSRNALLYISSSSVFVGATFSAANELSASAATAAIFQILMRVTIEAFLIRNDKSKFPIDSAQFRRNFAQYNCAKRGSSIQPKSRIEIGYNPQPFQSEMGTNRRDLRHLRRDQSRVTACGHDVKFPARKFLSPDLRKNLPNEPPITEYCSGQHRPDCRSPNRASRLFQRELWQQCRSLVKKIGHGFEPRRDDSANVIATR